MAAIATALRFVFTLGDGKQARPTVFFQSDGAGTDFDLLDNVANAAMDVAGTTDLMTNWGEDIVLETIEAQNMETVAPHTGYPNGQLVPLSIAVPSSRARIVGDSPSGVGGGPQLSIVWSLSSTTPGPKGRARMYLPGPPEADVNEAGRFGSELGSAIDDDMWEIVTTAMESAGGTEAVVVLSRKHGVAYPVVSHTVHNIARTQRRRALRS